MAKPVANAAEIGFVGDVTDVNADVIEGIMGMGYIPVIAPIGIDEARAAVQHQRGYGGRSCRFASWRGADDRRHGCAGHSEDGGRREAGASVR